MRCMVQELVDTIVVRITHDLHHTPPVGNKSQDKDLSREEDSAWKDQDDDNQERGTKRKGNELRGVEVSEEGKVMVRFADTDVNTETNNHSMGPDTLTSVAFQLEDVMPQESGSSGVGVLPDGRSVEEGDQQSEMPTGVEARVAGGWVSHTLATLLQVVAPSSLLPLSVSPTHVSPPTNNDVILANALLDYTWQKLNTGTSSAIVMLCIRYQLR